MNLGNLIVNLAVNLSALQQGLDRASQALNTWGKKAGEDMRQVGQAMSLYVTAPLAAMGAAAGKAAIDFESAFAGVRKTVDATEAQYAELERGIRGMAKTIPATANEIAAVAEAAGQLGIEREAIMGFSRVMIDLGESTNLASEEAATSLARLANITQMPQTQFDRLGSTVVALGNSLATTEAEIVEMGLRLAGAGKQVGMTEAQILGFAGALSSVGIAAEAGGTAFSRVFKDIFSAVKTGNKSLETFAQVAGMTAAEFKQAFEQDAAGAIIAFIEGLGKIGEAGGNTIAILEKLNLSDIRVSDSLLRASGAGDLFRQSIEKGTSAWQENTALTKEAEERYKTLASQLKITRNHLTEIAITFGRDLMPMIQDAAKGVRDLSEGFASLDPETRKAIIGFGAFAAAIGPVLVVLGTFLKAIGPGGTIAIALAGLKKGIGSFVLALNPLTVALLAVAGTFAYLADMIGKVHEAVDAAVASWSKYREVSAKVVADGGAAWRKHAQGIQLTADEARAATLYLRQLANEATDPARAAKLREQAAEMQKVYDGLRKAAGGGVDPKTGSPTFAPSAEEFTKLEGIQLAQARHSAKMISDAQYLNALRAEQARLERLGVTTSQEYLSVRAEISRMAPDQLAEANRQLQLDLERVKLWKTGKAGELKALQEHLARLQKIGGTELEQLQTQNRIAALQETKVDLAAKLKREHEEDLLISAKAGEGLDAQVVLQEAYVEKVRKAAEEKKGDIKLQDELLRAEKDLLTVKKRQADEQERQAKDAERMAKAIADANKKAFESVKGLAKGFAAAVDTSKIDDLVAKLAAQKDLVSKLEDMGAPAEDIERARKDETALQVDLDRAQQQQAGALPQFLADNMGAISELPTLLAGAATHLTSLSAAIVPLIPVIAAVAAAMVVLWQVWTQNAGGIQEAFSNLMAGFQSLWDGIVAFIQPFVGFIGEFIASSVNNFAGVLSILGGILQGIGWIFDKVLRPVLDPIAAAFRAVNNAIIDFINWIRGFFGGEKLKKAGEGAQERKQDAASQLTFPQMQIPKMAAQIGGAVGKAVGDVMGSFTSINPLPVEDVARANVFGIGPGSRYFYEKEARVSIDLNVTGEADPASIARAFEDSGLRSLLADTVGGEVSMRSLNPRFA